MRSRPTPSAWPVQPASPSSTSASCSTCWTPGGSNAALSSSGRAGPWSRPQSSCPIEPAASGRSCSGADEPQRAVTPRRLQLSRKPGWRKPSEAVVVSRPSRWGNPYPVATFGRDQAVALFRRYLADHPELVEAARQELAGKDLACWCKPGELCHADIWLEVANGKADR